MRSPVFRYKSPHPVTRFLIVINVAIFTMFALMNSSASKALFEQGVNFAPAVFHGEIYRMFTAMFLHFGILHILMNMMALNALGPLVESTFGRIGMILLYTLSGLAGSLASVSWHERSASAGASGAIFGLMGAFIALLLKKEIASTNPNASPLKSAMIVLALNLGISLIPGIDMAGHIGGLIMGFVLAWLFRPMRMIVSKRIVPHAIVISALALGVLLAVFQYMRLVKGAI